VDRNNLATLGIGIASLLVSLLVSIWISTRISQPLRLIAQEAQAIGQFALEPKDLGHSTIREVEQLIEATEDMKAGLRSFQKFVQRSSCATSWPLARGAHRWQRSTLTVLFSDLTGFTALAEKLNPEELVAQLGEYFGLASEQIEQSHGTLDKYVGDGVMAFWGAPRPDPAHALGACQAALGLQRGLRTLREKWQDEAGPRFMPAWASTPGRWC